MLAGVFLSNSVWSRNLKTRLLRPKLRYCATKRRRRRRRRRRRKRRKEKKRKEKKRKEKKRNTPCKGYHCTVRLSSFERHTKHCAQVNRNNEKQTKKREKQFFASALRCFGCKTLNPPPSPFPRADDAS